MPYSLSHQAVDEAAATWGCSHDQAIVRIHRENVRANARVTSLLAMAEQTGAQADICPSTAYFTRGEDTAIVHADGRVVGTGALADELRASR